MIEKGEIAIPEEKTRQLISMLEAVQHKDSINPKALASIVGEDHINGSRSRSYNSFAH